jgi:hypothetical protein
LEREPLATLERQGTGKRNRDAYRKAIRWTVAFCGSCDYQAVGVTRSVLDKTWENGCESPCGLEVPTATIIKKFHFKNSRIWLWPQEGSCYDLED